jgi:predicted metal-dependent phosphoesterase TrpH
LNPVLRSSTLRVDLHLHTTASDGRLSPTALVQLARARKIDIMAITDHDTTGGIAEALAAANGSPLLIPGIELSTAYDAEDADLLGYFINPADADLQTRLAALREGRVERARGMIERLADLGAPVDMQRVLAFAAGGTVGRPHIARALIEAGHVEGIGEAFERYLANGAPAYLSGDKLSPPEAIDLIHSAGGVAVLAHPALVDGYAALVERLVPAGLDGVEVAHPQNPNPVRANLRALARKYDLVMTGGSDFHRPEADSLGSVTPPPGCVPALRERMERYQSH